MTQVVQSRKGGLIEEELEIYLPEIYPDSAYSQQNDNLGKIFGAFLAFTAILSILICLVCGCIATTKVFARRTIIFINYAHCLAFTIMANVEFPPAAKQFLDNIYRIMIGSIS
jgi:hypothetical protein